MKRDKVITAEVAARVIMDDDTIATGGFVGIGFPEELAIALEKRFEETGSPKDLTLVYAAGQGDGHTKGVNHLAKEGLIRRVIGGHWALAPSLWELAAKSKIEAYCFPQGAISLLFREIAAHRPGLFTTVGINTFIDPRLQGGKLNDVTEEDLVELYEIEGTEYLFFKSFPIDVALLCGTTADEEGNVTMEKEPLTIEVLSIAQAVKNSGGIVLAQVERVSTQRLLSPREVKIPGVLVDGMVVAEPENHMQTFVENYNPAYTGEIIASADNIPHMPFDHRKVVVRRAAMFLKNNSVVGIGIGMSEDLASVAHEEGILDHVTFTVEAGGIGGVPAGGLSFGAVTNPDAIIDQPNQFDYYDGGGLDQGFLGAAEVDAEGNVNVSKFGTQFAGAGGFINISQNALNLYFLGSFTTKAEMEVGDGELKIVNEGSGKKFVERVEQVTFSGEYARERGQTVYYITERCVFELVEEGLKLVEIAPGVDLQNDILGQMEFRPIVPDEVSTMDEALFREEPMGLAERRTIDLEKRFHYDEENNVLYVNLEGLSIETEEDVSELAVLLDQELASSDKEVHAIVNYANLYLDPGARESFFDMLRRNEEECFLSSTGYSVDTLLRRQLREEFAEAGLEQRIYRNFDEARESFESTDL
jgi:propionate CoA-transferase